MHDVPFCSALSAVVVVQNLNFNQTQSNVFAPYLNTTAAFAPEIRLNLQQLRDFDTILYSFPVKGGTFDVANLDFELGSVTVYDPTLDPPLKSLNGTFSTTKPVITMNPPLVITPSQANVIVPGF